MPSFDYAYKLVRQLEGGFVNNPQDPGGRTNAGITQKTYDLFIEKHELPEKAVIDLTEDEIRSFYFDYWHQFRCDMINDTSEATVFFQFVVNAGNNAIRAIQEHCAITVDGIVGQQTLSPINNKIIDYNEILFIQLRYYRKLPSFVTFCRTWTERVIDTHNYIIGIQGK
jgi:lysozyme family protein